MSILERLLLACFGVIVALGLLEFSLRQLGPVVDPAAKNQWLGCVGWAGQPHQVITYHTDEFTTTEMINSAGLPDVEHSYAKPEGVFRILIIGDSFVEAYQVALEQSFPRLLEKRLNERRGPNAPRFEVIKAGYRSWGTDQEWLYFQCEGYKYAPDLVLVGFTVNDVVDNYLPLKADMADWPENAPPKPFYSLENGVLKQSNFPFPPPPVEVQPQIMYDYLYKYSITYRIAEKGWQSLQLKIAEMNQPSNRADKNVKWEANRFSGHLLNFVMPLYLGGAPPGYEQAWQLTHALLKAFHQAATEQGAAWAVFSTSQIWAVHPSVQQEFVYSDPLYAHTDVDWHQPDRVLGQMLQEKRVPFLPLNPGFRAYAAEHDDQWLFFREGHWNVEGHSLTAELLYNWLVEQQLVPQ